MKRKLLKIMSVVTVILMIGTLMCSCGKNDDDGNIFIPIRTGTGINYETAHAIIGTLTEKATLAGEFTTPYRTDLMFTRMSGTIDTIEVHQDQEVKAGDVIATLKGDTLEEDIVVQEIKLNSAKSTYETLQAQHASAEDIEFAKIALDLEQMAYDDLVESREYLVLKAPFDGKVTSIGNYRAGSHINKNTTLCTVSDSSRVRLTVADYNGVLSNISFGTKVTINQGTLVSTTGKVVDTVTSEMRWGGGFGFGFGNDDNGPRTVTSYIIQCDEDTEFLELGGIEVTFTTLRRDEAVIVPYEAVFEATDDLTNQTGTFVNVLINGIKIQTPVTVGVVTSDGRAEIVSGLSGDETLILR